MRLRSKSMLKSSAFLIGTGGIKHRIVSVYITASIKIKTSSSSSRGERISNNCEASLIYVAGSVHPDLD